MKFDIKSTQRNPRLLSFRLVVASMPGTLGRSVLGCPEGFAQCTVQAVGTGSYRMDFVTPFKRVPQVQVQPMHATLSLKAVITTRTASSITWLVKNDAGAATAPTEMDVTIIGYDSADQLG